MNYGTKVLAIPAGKCEFKLKSHDKENVINWAEEILSEGRIKNINYLPSALVFYSQQFYKPFSKEYREIKEIIYEHYGNFGDVSMYINKPEVTLNKPKETDKKRRGRKPKKEISPYMEYLEKKKKEDEENKNNPVEVEEKPNKLLRRK